MSLFRFVNIFAKILQEKDFKMSINQREVQILKSFKQQLQLKWMQFYKCIYKNFSLQKYKIQSLKTHWKNLETKSRFKWRITSIISEFQTFDISLNFSTSWLSVNLFKRFSLESRLFIEAWATELFSCGTRLISQRGVVKQLVKICQQIASSK